jgi:hypothetical protein
MAADIAAAVERERRAQAAWKFAGVYGLCSVFVEIALVAFVIIGRPYEDHSALGAFVNLVLIGLAIALARRYRTGFWRGLLATIAIRTAVALVGSIVVMSLGYG